MAGLLQAALQRSEEAEACGALVPLHTQLVTWPETSPFVVRRLLSDTPKHLRSAGPKPNPFLPWDPRLEVERPGPDHTLILNKFPVQRAHLLLISQSWQPQSGWLRRSDWQTLSAIEQRCPGLWFFNSCAAAGASQPHRHLQLLPRQADEMSCPLAAQFLAQLEGRQAAWPWRYRLSRRLAGSADAAAELEALYLQHQQELGLGDPRHEVQPQRPYNLLFDRQWFMTVERNQEHWAGFSINALGYAGCLLVTPESDQAWLLRNGPLALLKAVAAPS
ncbi:MAG: ATP adenylyltransferase [Prochlorococcaceae cyanobacterium]|jgi:ATP adenylyltransferase